MRLNFTGRRKIEKQHARIAVAEDPPGSGAGHYFSLFLDLSSYNLPMPARIVVEAYRRLTNMRFDFGTVGQLRNPAPELCRLADFRDGPAGVRFRIKVIQPIEPDIGKLLAEADGLSPAEGGVLPLLRISADDLGDTPYRLDLIPSDADLPTLVINTRIGGKSYASEPNIKPVLMTAVAREVLAAMVREGEVGDEPDHWANLWRYYACQVLGAPDPPGDNADEEEILAWVQTAIGLFATQEDLAEAIVQQREQLEGMTMEEVA